MMASFGESGGERGGEQPRGGRMGEASGVASKSGEEGRDRLGSNGLFSRAIHDVVDLPRRGTEAIAL
jgi:hypothetical protein